VKLCPTCQRNYADDSLRFCLDDGTTLSPFNDPQATLRFDTRQTDAAEQVSSISHRLALWLFVVGGVGIVGLVCIVALVVLFRNWSVSTHDRNRGENPAATGRETPRQITSPQQPQSRYESERELESVNNEVGSALLLGDLAALERLLADDYRYVSDAGISLTKPEILMLYRTGNIGYEYLTSSDVKVEVTSDLNKGVVSGRTKSKGQFRRQPFTDSNFFSNTYERRQGHWQLVSGTVWHH
jgi:Domain of unknown function (DUF4440)